MNRVRVENRLHSASSKMMANVTKKDTIKDILPSQLVKRIYKKIGECGSKTTFTLVAFQFIMHEI